MSRFVWQQMVNRCSRYVSLLSTLAKLRKATIWFVMSVCLSIRIEQLGSHWTDFDEILYLSFSKICRENSSLIKIRQK
jgi:hypothetical protein